MSQYDIALICDPRFKGGTRSAIKSDLTAFRAAGLSCAVLPVTSNNYFGPVDASVAAADFEDLREKNVDVVSARVPIEAEIAFFHHPAIFEHPVSNPTVIRTQRSFLVTHHPLFKGDGSMEFDPQSIQRNLRRQFGVDPIWAPISGLCRAHYKSMAPLISLSAENWPNTFITDEWTPGRKKLTNSDRLVIGRHGRPHRDKWPIDKALIEASLPATPWSHIRVMGAPQSLLDDMKVNYQSWDLVPFNGETPQAFLDSLDIFSYFHSPSWVEAFGRTIAEAMLMGVRCILPKSLETTFGPYAHYCDETDVPSVVDKIRSDLELERVAALEARDWARRAFNINSTLPRLERFKQDAGSRKRHGVTASPPILTARKLIGIKRRNRARFGKA